MTDTIFALSSGSLPSGVALVRISGVRSSDVLGLLGAAVPVARRAALRALKTLDGSPLDRALVLFFPSPDTATGEDCAELHLHGSRAVVAQTLRELSAIPGLRQAEPGEFARRAFLNGKMDLLGIEALADLMDAQTEAQRRYAVESAGAAQSALYGNWRRRLLHARAMTEAELDFSDEGDVPGSVAEAVWRDVSMLVGEIREHVGGFRRAEIIRDGFRVVLTGAPNAGKSSLLNALAKRDVAIVSDEPGTTRDVLEVVLDLNGYKVVLADTAGVRSGASGVEALGIERAVAKVRDADLVLRVVPATDDVACASVGELLIRSKADLGDAAGVEGLAVSVISGIGIDELLRQIGDRAAVAAGAIGDVLPWRARHVELLLTGANALEQALDVVAPLELKAEALRVAERSIGRVIGAAETEDLLGAIFSQFCIGK